MQFVVSLIALGLAGNVTAAGNQCTDVYSGAVQRIDYDRSESALVQLVYRNTCSSRNRSISGGFDSETQTIIQSVPVVSTLMGRFGASSNKTFCETVDNKRLESSASESLLVEPLELAMANFNQCLKILSRYNVEVSHSVINPGQVLITVDVPTQNHQIEIQSVTVSNGFSCRRPNRGILGLSGGQIKDGIPFTLTSTETITCSRTGRSVSGGDYEYPAADIGLGTTVGRYVIHIPDDTIYGPESKRSSGLEIRLRDSRIDALQNEITSLNYSMNNVKLETKNFYFGKHDVPFDAGKIFKTRTGCNIWHNKEAADAWFKAAPERFCRGANKTVLDHVYWRNGDECGYNYFTMTCATFPARDTQPTSRAQVGN